MEFPGIEINKLTKFYRGSSFDLDKKIPSGFRMGLNKIGDDLLSH